MCRIAKQWWILVPPVGVPRGRRGLLQPALAATESVRGVFTRREEPPPRRTGH